MYTLTAEKKLSVISALLEGNSIRSIERMTGVHRDTICRLLVEVGKNCHRILDHKMVDIRCKYLQCDELWTYVGKKQKRIKSEDSPELGDAWVFVALDEETKLIPVYTIGKRTKETTLAFLYELRGRLNDEHFQVTTDGYHFYRSIQGIFGSQCDFAQLIKLYGDIGQERGPDARYSPSGLSEVISRVIDGRPDPDHISTSFVERQNLTMRMQMRRFTRLTNAFSKKLENLKAACALHFAHYNFCRVHSSLRTTPAMAAGIASEVWPLQVLIS